MKLTLLQSGWLESDRTYLCINSLQFSYAFDLIDTNYKQQITLLQYQWKDDGALRVTSERRKRIKIDA